MVRAVSRRIAQRTCGPSCCAIAHPAGRSLGTRAASSAPVALYSTDCLCYGLPTAARRGSHKQGIVEHYDCSEFNPVGGALQADVDPSAGVLVEYQPGDVTFHHGRTLHYSGGNHTADRPRCGLSTHLWPTPNDIEDPAEAEALAVLLRERSQNRRLWADRTVRG